MRARKTNSMGLVLITILAGTSPIAAQESHVGHWTGHGDAGKSLYYRYCWGCHGFRGDGNGENAPYLSVLPRNFVTAAF